MEYAYLRDLWDWANAPNEVRRAIITDLLATDDVHQMAEASVLDWNLHFGVGTPVASSTVIQSPSRWSMQKYTANIADDGDFLATCKSSGRSTSSPI